MSKLDQTAERAWVRLLRVQRHALEAVEHRLKGEGFPPLAWYDVLLELSRSGEGLRQYEIAERVLLNKYNLSRLLDRLEGKGLISRKPCPQDGRASIVQATAKGLRLQKRMWPTYASAIETVFASRLNKTETAVLSSTLAKLLD